MWTSSCVSATRPTSRTSDGTENIGDRALLHPQPHKLTIDLSGAHAARSNSSTAISPEPALSRSADGGRHWSTPIKMNAFPSGVAAFTPSVDVASDGTVAVTYYDFRNNTPGTSTLPTDAFAVFSHDGGATFGGEVRLTPTSFDVDLAPRAGGLFLGDYVGLSHVGATFVPFYTQTVSSSNPTDIFASFVP
jgi:hypothetical protein